MQIYKTLLISSPVLVGEVDAGMPRQQRSPVSTHHGNCSHDGLGVLSMLIVLHAHMHERMTAWKEGVLLELGAMHN